MSPTAHGPMPKSSTDNTPVTADVISSAAVHLIHFRLIRFNDRGAIMGAIMGEREVYN